MREFKRDLNKESSRKRAQEKELKSENLRDKELKNGRSEELCPLGACFN